MDMPGRQYNAATGYRYGFNGKEKDNKDGVVQYDYGFRIYDPRLVRFKSVDPLTKSYPMLTPYQFASNSPIANVDLDGKEAEYYTTTITYTTVHRTGTSQEGGETTTSTTSSISTKRDETGWFTQGSLYTPNGALGSGTLYTVQTQTVDVYESALGLPLTTEVKGEPIVVGRAYKLSASDEKQMNQTIDRPQYTGSFQIMILGSGNGMYPGDQTGSKPDPNAETVVVDMNEWNEIFEPILIGMDVKSPIGMEPPEFGEILGEHFEQTVDKYKGSLSDRPVIIPAAGQALEPNSTVCSMCNMGPHPQDGIDAYITNKYGGVTDTLRKNDKTGKVDTIPTKPNTTPIKPN
jgi:RHS repeat-associated protein